MLMIREVSTMTARLSCLAIALLATSCGAQDTAPAREPAARAVELSGFSSDRMRIAEEIFAKLGSDSLIRAAELTDAPEVAGLPKRNKEAANTNQQVWLAMIPAEGLDPISRFRSEWQARVVLAAFWRRLGAAGDHGLAGGELVAPPDYDPEIGGTMRYFFDTESSGYLYTNAYNQASKLTADTEGFESEIRARAEEIGLRIERLDFGGIEGTTVEVEARAPDPLDYIENNGSLFGDPGELEGVFLVVRDEEGDVVQQMFYSTGLQSGGGGPTAKYTAAEG